MLNSNIKNKYDRSFGEILSSHRKEQGLSLDEVQGLLNIRKGFLHALERDDYEYLPSDAYVKCFIRSYARLLNLDGNDLIKLFLYEKVNTLKDDLKKNKEIKFHHFLVIPKIIKNILLGFAILLFLVYLGYEVKNILSPPNLIIDYPQNNIEISKNYLEIEGYTDKEAKIKINDQEILRNSDGGFKEKINLKKGVNIIKISAKNNHGKEKVEYREVMVVDNEDGLSLKE